MNDWYSAWVGRYVKAFVIQNPATITAMVEEWRVPLIDYLNATEAELNEVTRRCVALESPNFPGEHLTAIKRQLAAVKSDNARAAEQKQTQRASEYGTCIDCQDAGMVVVPHLRFVRGFDWLPSHFSPSGIPIRPTFAVYCNCHRGRKLFEARCVAVANTDKPVGLTLEKYRNLNPEWRNMLAANDHGRQALETAELRAEAMRLPNALASASRVPA